MSGTEPSYFCDRILGVRVRRPQMAEYRAYIIGMDGHFLRAIQLICPDDDNAKGSAKNLADGHDVELWQQGPPNRDFQAQA
jgi:hypothetical protein